MIRTLVQNAPDWFGAAVGCVFAVGGVSLLAVIVGRCVFSRLPASRHALLVTALFVVLAAPAVSMGLWMTGTALLRVPVPGGSDTSIQTASRDKDAIRIGEWATIVDFPASRDSEFEGRATNRVDPPIVGAEANPVREQSDGVADISVGLSGWLLVAGGLWSLGSSVLLVRVIRCWLTIRRLCRTARGIDILPIDGANTSEHSSEDFNDGAGGNDRLEVCIGIPVAESDVAVPMAAGVRRPMILLPRGLAGRLSSVQLGDVLTHELTHIRRGDNLVLVVEAVARVVFWPVLTLHVLLRDLADAREDACDNEVLATRDRVSYGETLLRLAELCVPGRPLLLTTDAFQESRSLAGRVGRILDERRSLSTRPRRTAFIAGFLLAIGLGVPLCGLSFTAVAQSDDETPRPFMVRLNDLMTVELVALLPHAGEDAAAWRPNGLAFDGPPDLPAWPDGFSTSHFQAEPYDCVLKFAGVDKERTVSYRTPGDMAAPDRNGKEQVRVACSNRSNGKELFLEVGVTDVEWGPWQSVDAGGRAEKLVSVSAACREAYDDIKPHHVVELVGAVRFCWTGLRTQDRQAEYEIVAIDDAGQRHKPYGTTAWDDAKETYGADIFKLPKAKIARFEYRLRPYRYWARFAPLATKNGEKVETKMSLTTAVINGDQQRGASAELNRVLNDLEQVHRTIRNLSVTTDFVKRQSFLLPVTEPVEMKFVMKAVVDSGGNVRSDTEGQQVNIEPDGKSVRLYDGRWVTAYRHNEIRGMPAGEARRLEWYEGRPSGASLDNHPTWHGIDPREFTTHYQHNLVTNIVRERGAEIAERATWDGRDVVVIQTVPRGDEQLRRYRFWIDPERKVIVRRAVAVQYKRDQPWQEYTRIECRNYREVAAGIWLPERVKYESVEVSPDLTPEKLSWRYEGLNRDWKVNQEIPAGTFDLEFPDGVHVNDHRSVVVPGKHSGADTSTFATLIVGYDMPGAEAETKVFIERIDPDFHAKHGHRDEYGNEEYGGVTFTRLRNGKSMKVEQLPPGRYLVARYRQVNIVRGDDGRALHSAYVDKQWIDLAKNETKSIRLSRSSGQPVSGRISIRPDRKVNTFVVHVCSQNAVGIISLVNRDVVEFDVRNADIDGNFQTEPLPPGRYTIVVEGYANHSLQLSGEIAPSWEGTAQVTVSDSSKPKTIDVALHEFDREGGRPSQSAAAKEDPAIMDLLRRARQKRQGPFGGTPYSQNERGQVVGLTLFEFALQPGDARTIAGMTQLQRLNLQGSNVSDEDLKSFAALKDLRELNLSRTKVGDAGVAALAELRGLTSLSLSGTQITDASLKSIGELVELRQLGLARTQITDAGLVSLAGLPRLIGLKLADTRITAAGLKSLEKLISLRGVTLDESAVTAEAIHAFAKRPGFEWMGQDEAVAKELARRQSVGDAAGVEAMLSAGLDLPIRGTFVTRSVTPHAPTPKDVDRQQARFRIEWDWNNEGRQEGLFAEVSIRQASVRVFEVGVIEAAR